jgi:hypothetical protein
MPCTVSNPQLLTSAQARNSRRDIAMPAPALDTGQWYNYAPFFLDALYKDLT